MIRFILFFFLISYNIFGQPVHKIDYFSRLNFTQEDFELNKIKNLKIKNRKRYSAYYTRDQKLPDKKTLVEEINFKNGVPVEKIFYNSHGGVRSKILYEYDKKNRLISEENHNEFGNIVYRRTVNYNPQNDTSEVSIIYNSRSKNERRQFLYDDSNVLVSIKHFDQNDRNFMTQKFIYENKKLKFLHILNAEGSVVNESEFVYNNEGNLTVEKQNGLEKKYIYDEKGRLIRVEFNNEKRIYKYNNSNYFEDDRFYMNGRRQFRLTFSYLKNGLVDEIIRYDSEDVKNFYSKYTYK